MTVRVLNGDCRTMLSTLDAGSVQTCVTSPPYFGLRDYGVAGQIGLEPTPDAFVAELVSVFREVRRVLRDDGTLWLNLGDSYAGSWGAQSREGTVAQGSDDGADRLSADAEGERRPKGTGAGSIPVRSTISAQQIVAHPKRTHTGSVRHLGGIKAKDLIGIPWRVAFALQADGWYLRSDIIWAKKNCMPESVTDRPTKSHEYLFLLSKQPTYYYDADAIAEPATTDPDRESVVRGGFDGKTNALVGRESFRAVTATRNRRTVWTVATQPYSGAHFATFPPALIEPCILAGSAKQACETCGAPWARVVERGTDPLYVPLAERAPHGATQPGNATIKSGTFGSGRPVVADRGFAPTCDCETNTGAGRSVVLDPFLGAGTTALVADRLGRDCIGVELNPAYAQLARRRLEADAGLFNPLSDALPAYDKTGTDQ